MNSKLKEEIKVIGSDLTLSGSSAYAITRSSRSKTPALSKTGEGEIRTILTGRLLLDERFRSINKRSIFMNESVQLYNLVTKSKAERCTDFFISKFDSRTQFACSPMAIDGDKIIMFVVPDVVTGMALFEEDITNFDQRIWTLRSQAFGLNSNKVKPEITKVSIVYVWFPVQEFEDKLSEYEPYSDEYKWLSNFMDSCESKVGGDRQLYNTVLDTDMRVIEYTFDLEDSDRDLLENSLKLVDIYIDNML